MLSPLPRRSGWAYCFAHFTQPCQPSPKGSSGQPAHRPFRGLLGVHSRYGLHTRAVTVYRDTLSEGFSHFVTSMTAPVASGWSGRRVGLAPTGKRRLVTAHTQCGHLASLMIAGNHRDEVSELSHLLPNGIVGVPFKNDPRHANEQGQERQARPLVVGCSTETGSDAGKVFLRASSSASSWRLRLSLSPSS